MGEGTRATRFGSCRPSRCRVLRKEGVGDVHLHRSWWRPSQVQEMWFRPIDRRTMFLLDEDDWEQAVQTGDAHRLMMLAHRSGISRPAP